MTTITAQDEIDLRRKIGNGGRGFSTPDLDSIWVESGERITKSLWICFEELMNDTARFNDYTQNDTQEKREQIFKHIAEVLVPYWKKKTEAEDLLAASYGIPRIVGMKSVPPRCVERPINDPDAFPNGWRHR